MNAEHHPDPEVSDLSGNTTAENQLGAAALTNADLDTLDDYDADEPLGPVASQPCEMWQGADEESVAWLLDSTAEAGLRLDEALNELTLTRMSREEFRQISECDDRWRQYIAMVGPDPEDQG